MSFDFSYLKKGVMEVTFVRKDGSERVMKCTQLWDFIPEDMKPVNGDMVYDENQVRVFDLEKQQWRSFLKDSVVSASVLA